MTFSLGRPVSLPLRSLLLVETFSISSSVSLDHSSSTFRYEQAAGSREVITVELFFLECHMFLPRIILDEAALFLSDKSNAVSVNLVRGELTLVLILINCLKCSTATLTNVFFCFFRYRLCASG